MRTKGKIFLTTIVVLILMLGGVYYYLSYIKRELDDASINGPIKSEIITSIERTPLFDGVLAAGITWDYDNNRFLVSTDQPQGLRTLLPFASTAAYFHVVDSTLSKLLYTKSIEPDGDLEGIAYIGNNEVAIMSEVGTIYYLKENNGAWEETGTAFIFDAADVRTHKLGSLAYDSVNKHLYTAEKVGKKTIYQITRDGAMLGSFDFTNENVGFPSKRTYSIMDDYTIAGMTFGNNNLYIWSEAYSTLFELDIKTREVNQVYGMGGVHESSGVTIKDGMIYLVGDTEGYLPPPQFYKASLSSVQKELDDVSINGPIKSEIITSVEKTPLFEDVLAAGITWDYDNDQFLISTDQPHGVQDLSASASTAAYFHVVDSTLTKLLYTKSIEPDGDLEGIAYIGNNEVAIMSELGTIYYLRESNGAWKETGTAFIFDANDSSPHKLGSFAYDSVNKHLYTAEKEGKKIIYQIARDGTLLDSFELTSKSIGLPSNRNYSMAKDYTIAGMTFENNNLYIWSEAYSTLFKFDIKTRKVNQVYGMDGVHESAGVTIKNGVVYLVGDVESYLPPPQFYKASLSN